MAAPVATIDAGPAGIGRRLLGVIPFGNLLAGAIAERFGAPLALAGGGSATLLFLVGVAIAFPALRSLRPEPGLSASR
jgi:hypothetical protein